MAAALCHGKCKPLADRNNCWTCGDMTDGWCCIVNASGFRWPYEPDVLELLEHEAPYAAAAEYSALGDDRILPCSSRSGDGDTDSARFLP